LLLATLVEKVFFSRRILEEGSLNKTDYKKETGCVCSCFFQMGKTPHSARTVVQPMLKHETQ
jgi:hypothetical protein